MLIRVLVPQSHLLLERCHAWHEEHGPELDGALHVEVGGCQGVQELLECQLEELCALLLRHLSKRTRSVY